MGNWIFYEKDGTTEICQIPDVVEVTRQGKIMKILTFGLDSSANYDKLMSMCANVEPYFAKRIPLQGAILFVDNSPSQKNTVKVVDPSGEETGYGILQDFTPVRLPSSGDLRTFELKVLWIGDNDESGNEIQNGVYKVTLS